MDLKFVLILTDLFKLIQNLKWKLFKRNHNNHEDEVLEGNQIGEEENNSKDLNNNLNDNNKLKKKMYNKGIWYNIPNKNNRLT